MFEEVENVRDGGAEVPAGTRKSAAKEDYLEV